MPSADNIATFVDVVRHESLSGAARSLGVPKSTVSRRLMRLEAELHNKLLHRDARKITLTPAGRRFYDSVASAVDALGAAVSALEDSSREPRGTIRITAPPDLGRTILSPILVAFLERYGDIALDVMLTTRVVDLVQEEVDLAVRASRVAKGTLIARKLCESQLQLAAARERAPKLSDPRALEQQSFVLYRAGRTQPMRLEHSSGKRQDITATGRLSVDDYAALAELVAAGRGIGLMPAIHVRDGVQSGRLTRLLPEWSSPAAPVCLVYASRQRPERVRLLAEFLIDAFARIEHV